MNTQRVLVTAASKHGATHEIADALARRMQEHPEAVPAELVAASVPVERGPDPRTYDAVVLGSAVYAGSWREEARHFATEHAATLRQRPVWLFSSGPIGDPPFPPDEPHDVAALTHLIGARGHRILPGRLEKNRLTFPERAMVTAMRAPVGDFRDWGLVRVWADAIVAALVGEVVPTTPRADRGPAGADARRDSGYGVQEHGRQAT
ncbi:flavodoxin domain-containing protein [Geodermatophilus sp. YIM 151500]|uniref:flavodoxin domain-containing protein n=1 Tax=Geodermatophilus sp. YIM 151500 TaxID=2984531 RepID=UPI0021E36ECF|nr:flavodoxin domain-containing protein [Geodermatophilus sp. YIM 151500]MCV2487892.1 flavodoxin domain-containing protein [Geodermatophilus sp. YIM 151500]